MGKPPFRGPEPIAILDDWTVVSTPSTPNQTIARSSSSSSSVGSEVWTRMPRPIIALAPMDGITDSAYRRIVRQINPEVVLFSEFTSADGYLRSDHVRQRLDFSPDESPFFVQLFGNNPNTFAESSKALEQTGVTGIDINMGCPSKKIVASQHGSGLMREVDTACRIVEAVAKAVSLPVSVKTRLGWKNDEQLVPFTQSLVSAGATLITIHGRTYNQGFKGEANWAPIHALKQMLPVPVLGNGDVQTIADGLERLGPLDGFMIGRAAIGNPWAFLPPDQMRTPTMAERLEVMEQHYHAMRQTKPPRRAVLEFRKHMVGYFKGLENAKALKAMLMQSDEEAVFLEGLARLKVEGEDLAHRGSHEPPQQATA